MSLKGFWYYLTGNSDEFSLEYRIFNSFCIIAILALATCVPLNYALKLPISALLSFCATIVQTYLYYLSRYRKKSKISMQLSIIFIHIVLVINYYYNSGIDGPSILLLLVIFFLVISVSEPTGFLPWIVFNLLVVSAIMLLEYFNPQYIQSTYVNRETRFADIYSSYLLCAITMFIGLRYIKKNYYLAQGMLEQKANDLERINQTKNKMFSIVSHDLRAPIASIHSYLEILSEMDLMEKDKDQLRNELKHMTQNTNIMLSNLLLWSRSQMEGIVLSRKDINLANTIIPVIDIFQNVAAGKGVDLSYEVDPALEVYADKDMLELVIRNLVSNAIKFTPGGGSVNIQASCIDAKCQILVKDTGVGMDDLVKDSIFSLKAESSYGTNNEKGVGLGLSLTKEFTEMQEGSIRFESTLGNGTTFYLTLPASGKQNINPARNPSLSHLSL